MGASLPPAVGDDKDEIRDEVHALHEAFRPKRFFLLEIIIQ
jgi:hypothetical protein